MPSQDVNLYALNRGEVSELSLARVDNQAMRLSAEIQENFLPRVLGPMTLRPGTAFVGEIAGDNQCKLIPFIFSGEDTAIIELTPNLARFWVNDALVTRAAVATVVNNFVTAEWVTVQSLGSSISVNGSLQISNVSAGVTTSANYSIRVAAPDQATPHALRFIVAAGPIDFRMGTSYEGQEVFLQKSFATGTYSITFTPNAGTIYIQFSVTNQVAFREVSFIGLDGPGVFTLPTPFAAADLPNISFDASADVVFIAVAGQRPSVLSRYTVPDGWGIGPYLTSAGPFPAVDGDKSILLKTSVTQGNVVVTSNFPFFTQQMIGQQLRLFHAANQTVSCNIVVDNTYCAAIRVNGVARDQQDNHVNDRNFLVTIAGSWSGVILLERSVTSATEGFSAVGNMYGAAGVMGEQENVVFTTNKSNLVLFDDIQNEICWYRLGAPLGGGLTGYATVVMLYPAGADYGYGRIYSLNSSSSANVEVLKPYCVAIAEAESWRLDEWSTVLGFPTCLQFHEGRLWFAAAGRIFGSVSDQFYSFDDSIIGDSGAIDRSIGSGPITNIRWLLSSYRLEIGGDTSVIACRSDSLDTPLTPTNFSLRQFSTLGTRPIQPIRFDLRGFYVGQSNRRVFEISFTQYVFLEQRRDVTRLNLDIGIPGFVEMAAMEEPDTRLHLVRADGQVAILLTEIDENVNAWVRFVTDGLVENVIALPGNLETKIYYVVHRNINGQTKRYLERCARMDECQGGTISKLADCHSIYSGALTFSITGLGYLEGKQVVVWADGSEVDGGPFTVSGGGITLPILVHNAVVGLPYTATFKSAKLAYAAKDGTAINRIKRVDHIGLLLANTHFQGLQYGTDASNLSNLPLIEGGVVTPDDTIYAEYDQEMIEFPGQFSTDSRVYITAAAPRPVTIMGITIGMTTDG